jgi:hypothetical protein
MTVPASVHVAYQTIQVAIAAFHAENPKQVPTKAHLLHGFGGPFLRSWPHIHHWVFAINHGTLVLHHIG